MFVSVREMRVAHLRRDRSALQRQVEVDSHRAHRPEHEHGQRLRLHELPGPAADASGTYSHALGKAIVHDSFVDSLRAYALGESGGGTTIATGLSASTSRGEKATLVEIASSCTLGCLSANTGTLSLASGGTQTLGIDFGATFGGSIYLVLGSYSGWTRPEPRLIARSSWVANSISLA